MKAASALHFLALGACFVVQSSRLELSGLPGVRRAVQIMEARGATITADKTVVPLTSPPQATYTVVGPTIILEPIDYNRGFHIGCLMWLITDVVSGEMSSIPWG
jgi:hypothetical protein